MVSKASELLPLPESPVTTTISSRGRETVTFFRLCSRAPRTTIRFSAISYHPFSSLLLRKYTAPAREAKCEITFLKFYHLPSDLWANWPTAAGDGTGIFGPASKAFTLRPRLELG